MEHHDRALQRYLARTTPRPEVLGVLLTGSLARGEERPDSDVDLVVVVTDAAWSAALAAERIMLVEVEDAGYDGGYFDVKLATIEQLRSAPLRGDEPVKRSLGEAKVVYDQGFGLAELVAGIAASTTVDAQALAASLVAQARLHGGYFLQQGAQHHDPFLTAHAAVHLGLASGRAVLALAGIGFPGPKGLVTALRGAPDPGPEVADAVVLVTREPSPAAADALLALLESVAGDLLRDESTLSRFVLDNELAWFTRVSPPEYR